MCTSTRPFLLIDRILRLTLVAPVSLIEARTSPIQLLPPNIMSSTVMMGAISPITAAKVLVLAAVLVIVFLYTQKTRKQATSKSAHLAPSEKLWRTPAPKPLLDFDLAKAEPIKYRPFRHGTTHVTMGIRSLNWDEWIEMDKNFIRYHDVKVSELEKSTTDHVQYVDNAVTRLACYEVLEELAQFLPARYPSVFSTNGDQLSNSATGECFSLSHCTSPIYFSDNV